MSTNNLPNVSVIEKTTLRSIGNAIREKTKGTSEIPVPDMAAVIRSIKSDPKLTETTVTPARTASFVVPPEGFDGFSKVNVEAAALEEATVTPTTEEQVFTPSGDNIGFSKFTVKAAEGGGVEYPNVMEVIF